MSKIDELLKNEKVEWKKLGDVCEILDSKRKPITKSKRISGEYPYYGANGIQDYVNDFIFDGTFILMGEDGSVINKDNTPILHWVKNSKIWVNNHAHVLGELDSKYILKYIYYYLSTVDISSFVKGIPPKINQGNMKQIEVPIPSLETQEKIVEILDKFTNYVTELQAELQAELQDRTKQYEYYRDMLLSEDYLGKMSRGPELLGFDSRIKITTLGKIAKVNRGASPRPISKYLTEDVNGVPWIKIGDVGSNSKFVSKTAQRITVEGAKKSRTLEKGDFIISNSMSYGRPYILNIDGAIHDGWASISEFNEKLDSDFLYYYLTTTKVKNYWEGKINSSSVSNLNSEIIRSLPIPLIDKKLQKAIANILDKFQALLADTEGLLPQEIEQRQKQYEYFREKLLTFDENVVSKQASKQASKIISNRYYQLLEEACELVQIDCFKITMGKLSDYLIETKNIRWNDKEEFTYIDLSSIDRENNSIQETTLVNKNNAPSRARQLIKKKDVLFGTTRPLLKRYYFVEEEYDGQLCSTGFCVLRANEEKMLPKWIYYNIMTSKFLEFVKINEKGTSYPSIADSIVKEYKIPVPPIPIQEHVVSILDKFDELVNDISAGIPKEIELRQKEYEFYREKLLNFPR